MAFSNRMQLLIWLVLLHCSAIYMGNQSVIVVKINGNPVKLVYQTWMTAEQNEHGEWKSFDGSLNCIEQDATNAIIVESDGQIPMRFFDRYTDIESIEMTHKQLKTLDTSHLLNANSLLRLNVSHNDIDSIVPFAFESAPKLTEIDLSFNLLHDLNENVFTSYLIKYLYLHNNQLTVLNPLLFENLLYLRVLTLNNNRIHAIDWRLFNFCSGIDVLMLHTNDITDVHNSTHTPRSMQTFSMYDNPVAVESHEWIWLDAMTVDVRNTGVQICRVSRQTSTLIAANNEIREINLDYLNGPHENALVTLDLAYNQLQNIVNVTYFHRLQYLNLSHNLVSEIEAKVFAQLKDLRHLYLSHNKLKRFAVSHRLPNLIALNVSFNEILTLDLNGIMSQLKSLNVDGNRLQATESLVKRHTVNHEEQCLADATGCTDETNRNYEMHPKQPQISDDIREVIHGQFQIMEKNIMLLIDSRFDQIEQRVKRLEQEMIVITTNRPDLDNN